ncbi:hypothetical protein [Nocardiopsis sp. CC223A]|uniref:hypothetical protein n=1 Tax=Nocardiopsis sp. CC223A TaxID=3044051 RepID=UPI00278BBE2F|nr:hypothetical protein [Nocardiopsis sp. CC223A]
MTFKDPVPLPALPPPEQMWGGPAAIAVLGVLVPDHDSPWQRWGRALDHDHSEGRCCLALVEGGRAVLFGHDVDGSRTGHAAPAVDLLAGGPHWLPWEWLVKALHDAGIVSFLSWWDGRAWYRAPLPEGVDEVLHPGADADDVYTSLEEFCFEGGWDDDDEALPERQEDLRARLTDLVAAASARRLDEGVLRGLADVLPDPDAADVEGALAEARRLGVTGEEEPPALPAGTGEPDGRRVHLPQGQAGASVGMAAREGVERPRPAPAGPGPAGRAFLDWADGHAPHRVTVSAVGYGDITVRVGAAHLPAPAHGGADPAVALARAWREEEADPRSGAWLYARVDTGRGTVERVYDRLPEWAYPAEMATRALARLRGEMAARDEEWRPEWASLLAEDFVRDGAPPHLCWRPGIPVVLR